MQKSVIDKHDIKKEDIYIGQIRNVKEFWKKIDALTIFLITCKEGCVCVCERDLTLVGGLRPHRDDDVVVGAVLCRLTKYR